MQSETLDSLLCQTILSGPFLILQCLIYFLMLPEIRNYSFSVNNNNNLKAMASVCVTGLKSMFHEDIIGD